jgi:hypothetical protein
LDCSSSGVVVTMAEAVAVVAFIAVTSS